MLVILGSTTASQVRHRSIPSFKGEFKYCVKNDNSLTLVIKYAHAKISRIVKVRRRSKVVARASDKW